MEVSKSDSSPSLSDKNLCTQSQEGCTFLLCEDLSRKSCDKGGALSRVLCGGVLTSLPGLYGVGNWRPIINLKYLKKFILKERFKMKSLQMIMHVIQPGN